MKILAADMWPGITLGDPNQRYQQFLSIGRPRFSGFIESILLYDEIVVPTDDFMSLAILVGVLGEDAIVALLREGILRFVRFRGTVGYAGTGGTVHGLVNFSIVPQNQGLEPSAWGATEKAVNWALGGLNAKIDILGLTKRVLEQTRDVELGSIFSDIKKRADDTILTSDALRGELGTLDFSALPGIKPNDVRIYGGVGNEIRKNAGDKVDTYLAIARAQLEAHALDDMNCDDARTATRIGEVLTASSSPNLGVLRQCTNVPDIAELILNKSLTIRELLKIRSSRDWPAFRDWFHRVGQKEPMEVAREYISFLKDVPYIERLPARTIRFIATTAIGLFEPTKIGITASGIDSFALGALRQSSPKYFIERLEQLAKPQRGFWKP